MQESGVDLSYDVPKSRMAGQAYDPDQPKVGVGKTNKLQPASLRSTQRMALMKQQYEQAGTGLSPHELLQQQHKPEQQSAAQRDLQQRIRERLQLKQQQLQQQQENEANNIRTQPLGADQRPKRLCIIKSSSVSDHGAARPTPWLGLGLKPLDPAEVEGEGGPQMAMSAPLVDGFDLRQADVTSPFSVGLSSTATSVSEYEDLLTDLDMIASMEGEQADASLPNAMLDTLSYHEEALPQSIVAAMHQSASCPSIPMIPLQLALPLEGRYRGGRRKEAPPPVMSEAQRRAYEKERMKKDTHNDIEKRRREKINDHIQELATLLPTTYDLDLQNKKGTILQASVDYIKKLQRDQEKIKKMEEEQRQLERRNRQLQLQMQMIQSQQQQQPQQPQQQPQQQQQQQHELEQQLLQQLLQQHLILQQQPAQQLQQQPSPQQLQQPSPQQLQQQQEQQQQSELLQQQHQEQQQRSELHQQSELQLKLTEHLLNEIAEGEVTLDNDPLMFDSKFDSLTFDSLPPQPLNVIEDLMDVGCQELIDDNGTHYSFVTMDETGQFQNYLQ